MLILVKQCHLVTRILIRMQFMRALFVNINASDSKLIKIYQNSRFGFTFISSSMRDGGALFLICYIYSIAYLKFFFFGPCYPGINNIPIGKTYFNCIACKYFFFITRFCVNQLRSNIRIYYFVCVVV